MKTQLIERSDKRSDISYLSEFDPAPFIYSIFLKFILKENMNTKKVLDSIRPHNLRSLRSVNCGLTEGGADRC